MSSSKHGSIPRQLTEDATQVEAIMMEEPRDAAAFLRRGYAFYGSGQYDRSIDDFKRAIDLEEKNVDAIYALGMSLKASGKKEEAIALFKKAIALLDQGVVIDKSRSRMLRRLALGHVNDINTGDWNLEGEIWQRVA